MWKNKEGRGERMRKVKIQDVALTLGIGCTQLIPVQSEQGIKSLLAILGKAYRES